MITSGKAFKDANKPKVKLDEDLLIPILMKRMMEDEVINCSTYLNVQKETKKSEK